jgi:hypothetical protein
MLKATILRVRRIFRSVYDLFNSVDPEVSEWIGYPVLPGWAWPPSMAMLMPHMDELERLKEREKAKGAQPDEVKPDDA